MKLTKKQIDKIIELRLAGLGVETIAKKPKHSKNTIRKYLRLYGYLLYQYPPNLHRGPPNLLNYIHNTSSKTNEWKPGITQELDKRNKEIEEKDKKINELNLKKTELENNLEKAIEQEQKNNNKIKNLQDENTKLKYELSNIKEQNNKIIQENQQKINELTINLKDVYDLHNKYRVKKEAEHSEQIKKINNDKTLLQEEITNLNKKIIEITDENNKLKYPVTILEKKQKNHIPEYFFSTVDGFIKGFIKYYPVPKKNNNPIHQLDTKYGKK